MVAAELPLDRENDTPLLGIRFRADIDADGLIEIFQ